MHIPDGILPVGVSAAGYITTSAATWYAIKQIEKQEDPRAGVPKTALLTAAFFVATWINIPVPPTSVHLVLNGLLGVILGWYAMPAIVVGLFMQAVMFQHGGLVSLGVNATMMGVPALLAAGLFQLHYHIKKPWGMPVFAFLGGSFGLLIAAGIAFAILISTASASANVLVERNAIIALTLAHIPLAIIEGIFTALVVVYIKRVKPDMLPGYTAIAETAGD